MQIPLKRGMLIRHQDHLYLVADFRERQTGKQKATVHVTLRDLRDGHQSDRTLEELLPLVEVEHAYRQMQYLYAKGDTLVFMDTESFDEHELTDAQAGGFRPFLMEGETYRVMCVEQRPMSLVMPDTVVLRVETTAAPTHSGGGSNVTKEAEMENGLTIHVPLFVKTGDLIRVSTQSRSYAGKEKQ